MYIFYYNMDKSMSKNVSSEDEVRPMATQSEAGCVNEIRTPNERYDTDGPADMEMDEPVATEDRATIEGTRGISINPLNSGYLVKVGCQSVAVETTEKLIDMLNKYLSNPRDFENKWYSKDVRNKLDNI